MKHLFKIFLVFVLLGVGLYTKAQNCGFQNTSQFLNCGSNCGDISVTKQLNKSTENYLVQSIPYTPLPYINSDGNELNSLYIDDVYSGVVDLPFEFCFFGQKYDKMVVGSNGLITFDLSNANTTNGYFLNVSGVPQPIPYAGGTPNLLSTCYYPKTAIMGAMLDIDPSLTSPNKKIEWKVFGTSPCRRMVINFNNIKIFGFTTLTCTSQIILYENTGVIDVNVASKPLVNSTTSNSRLAIIGIQNFARDIGIAPTGRNCGSWGATNESWRFIPNGPTNLLQNVQLINASTSAVITTLSNTQVTYDAVGNFTANFLNQCQTTDTAKYIVKSNFTACFDPLLTLTNIDTITTIKRKKLNIAAIGSTILCGQATGTITATSGTSAPTDGPFTYSIGGTNSATGVFNLAAGTYQVVITNGKPNFCNDTIAATITPAASYTFTTTPTNVPCTPAGAQGTITVNVTPAIAINPPYVYSLDNITYQSSNVFNVNAGTYTAYVKDASGCVVPGTPVTVSNSTLPMPNGAVTNANCLALASGNITATPVGTFTYSIDGLTYQPSNSFSVAPGNYTLYVQNAVGCIGTTNVVVGLTNNLVVLLTKTDATCSTNGTITVTATPAGANEYSIDGGVTYQTSNVFSVPTGSYTIKTKTPAGCTDSKDITVGQINNITVSSVNVQPTCATQGTITVTAMPAGVYQYSIDGGTTYQASNVFTQPAGPYTITVKDASGCTKTLAVTLTQINSIMVTFANTNVLCSSGATTGTIVVNVTPADVYTYSFDGGVTFIASNTFAAAPGNYSIVVKSSASCSRNANTAITLTNDITLTLTQTDAVCSNNANGTITANSTPASGAYEYSIDGGVTYQASNTFSRPAGNYTIRVKSSGPATCFNNATTTIAQLNNITATTTIAPFNCSSGAITTAVTVNALPATGTYQYSSNGGATYQTSNIFNLGAGNYAIRVQSNGPASCFVDVATTVTLNNDIAATTTVTPFTCSSGATTTTVTINATPASGLYQYSSNAGATYQASNIFNLMVGNYTIRVKTNGAASCFIDVPTTVAVTNNITATATVIDAICSGTGLGSVTINATPAGSYQYSIDAGVTYQASNVFNVAASNYNFIVKAAGPASCTFNVNNVTVGITNNLSVMALTTNATCSGGNNGTITAMVTPAGTYQYSIDAGATYQASNVFNVVPGSYIVTIKNTNCTATSSTLVVGQTNNLMVTATSTAASCAIGNDGTITATAMPNMGTYQYSINAGTTYQASNVFTGLVTGNYTVTIKNNNNCTLNSSIVNVPQTNNIAATLATTNATCSGLPDGTITVTVASGTGYTYALDAGAFGTSNVLSAGVGPHIVTVQSASGCTKNFNANITFTNNFIFTLSDTLTKCEGVGKILDGVSNFSAATTVAWLPITNLSNPLTIAPITNTNTNIKYYAAATYGICTIIDSVYITVTNKPIVDAGLNDTLCVGESSFLNGNITGVYSSYNWSPATFLSNTNTLLPAITAPTATTTYVLTATDAGGCNFVIKDSVTITVVQALKTILVRNLLVPTGIATAIPLFIDSTNFGATTTMASFNYSWLPTTGLSLGNTRQPLATVFSPTLYTVKVSLGDCFVLDSIYLKPYLGPAIYMPTAFVPSTGRTVNKVAIPTYIGIKTLKYFTIYDRWGKPVFTTANMFKGWDGKLQGKEQHTQTYVVAIEAIDINNKIIRQQATLTLIR